MPSTRTIRRCIGGIFLAGALIMLVLGMTWLKPRLHDAAFIRYWLICFAFTAAALLVALIDVIMIKRETKAEQEELLNQTLHDIEDDEEEEDSEK